MQISFDNRQVSKGAGEDAKSTLDMLYHITGGTIRWMFNRTYLHSVFILFGCQSVRQAMGIATAGWSFIHFIIFGLGRPLGKHLLKLIT
jgi:sulfoxide reductase heme-binding subunit YedZ